MTWIDGVITQLESDILECKVKWALRRITTNKAGRSDGIPAELLRIIKDVAMKVLNSICQQICKIQQWPQDWKRSDFIPIPKKGNAKECSYYLTINTHFTHQHIKSRDITLPTKVHLVKAVVYPVVMYGCESWTIEKAEQ